MAAADSSGPAVPLDALSVVLESFVPQVEVCGSKAGKKHPLPPPSSGEDSRVYPTLSTQMTQPLIPLTVRRSTQRQSLRIKKHWWSRSLLQ